MQKLTKKSHVVIRETFTGRLTVLLPSYFSRSKVGTHGLISTFPLLPVVLTLSARMEREEIKMKHNFCEDPTLIF